MQRRKWRLGLGWIPRIFFKTRTGGGRFWLDDHQCVLPVEQVRPQSQRKASCICQSPRSGLTFLVKGQLLTQKEILSGQDRPGTRQACDITNAFRDRINKDANEILKTLLELRHQEPALYVPECCGKADPNCPRATGCPAICAASNFCGPHPARGSTSPMTFIHVKL
jgi:hypothetical protein